MPDKRSDFVLKVDFSAFQFFSHQIQLQYTYNYAMGMPVFFQYCRSSAQKNNWHKKNLLCFGFFMQKTIIKSNFCSFFAQFMMKKLMRFFWVTKKSSIDVKRLFANKADVRCKFFLWEAHSAFFWMK